MVDQFINWLVGDRCPADPCASENGLKMRTYAVTIVPTLLLAYLSFLLQTGSLPARILAGLAGVWVVGSMLIVPRRISDMEPCDEVESHYGEER